MATAYWTYAAGDYLRITQANGADDLNPTDMFSVVALVKITAHGAIISKIGASGGYELWSDGSGLHFRVYQDGSTFSTIDVSGIPLNVQVVVWGFYFSGGFLSNGILAAGYAPITGTRTDNIVNNAVPSVASVSDDFKFGDGTVASGFAGQGYWFGFRDQHEMSQWKAVRLIEEWNDEGDGLPTAIGLNAFVDHHQAVAATYTADFPFGNSYVFDVIGTPTRDGTTVETFDHQTSGWFFNADNRVDGLDWCPYLPHASGGSDMSPGQTSFSVASWYRGFNTFYGGRLANNIQHMFCKWNHLDNKREWMLRQSGSDVQFYISRDGDSSPLSSVSKSGVASRDRGIQFACGTYNYVGVGTVNTMRLYVDSLSVVSLTTAYNMVSAMDAPVVIGGEWRSTEPYMDFKGVVLCCAYFNYELSAAQVADLRDGVETPNSLGAIMAWHGNRLPAATYRAEIGTGAGAPYDFTVDDWESARYGFERINADATYNSINQASSFLDWLAKSVSVIGRNIPKELSITKGIASIGETELFPRYAVRRGPINIPKALSFNRFLGTASIIRLRSGGLIP